MLQIIGCVCGLQTIENYKPTYAHLQSLTKSPKIEKLTAAVLGEFFSFYEPMCNGWCYGNTTAIFGIYDIRKMIRELLTNIHWGKLQQFIQSM